MYFRDFSHIFFVFLLILGACQKKDSDPISPNRIVLWEQDDFVLHPKWWDNYSEVRRLPPLFIDDDTVLYQQDGIYIRSLGWEVFCGLELDLDLSLYQQLYIEIEFDTCEVYRHVSADIPGPTDSYWYGGTSIEVGIDSNLFTFPQHVPEGYIKPVEFDSTTPPPPFTSREYYYPILRFRQQSLWITLNRSNIIASAATSRDDQYEMDVEGRDYSSRLELTLRSHPWLSLHGRGYPDVSPNICVIKAVRVHAFE